MIVDASAILAVLLREREADDFMRAFAGEQELSMSPINYLEACVRLITRKEDPGKVDELMALSATRNELNLKSPSIPRRAFITARRGIEEGEATHKADKED